MYLLENVFTNEHGEAITVLQLLTKFKNVLSEIDTYLNEYGNRLNSIEFKNTEQNRDILNLKSQVATLQTKVNNIQLTLGDYLLRFNDLDVQLSVINGKIDVNIADIATLKTYVNNLGVQLININNILNLLDLTVQGHTTKITNLETSVSSINSDLVDIDSSIVLINTQLSNLPTDLNLLTSRVGDLETNDTWQNEQIYSLTTFTQLNTNNISTLNTLVGNLDDRLDVLESQTSIEHELIPHNNLTGYVTVNANNYLHIFPYPTDITKYTENTYLSMLIDGNISIQRNGTPTLSFMMPDNDLIEFILPSSTDTYSFINFKLYLNFFISTTNTPNRLYYWGNLLINDGSNNFNKNIGTAGYQPTGTNENIPLANNYFKVKCSTQIYHRGHFLVTNFK